MHIGLKRLLVPAEPGDQDRLICIIQRLGCVRARQHQDAVLHRPVHRDVTLHALDGRGEILVARPVRRNQQLGLVVVRIARHQHGGLHLLDRRGAVGVRPGDFPAVVVQLIVHAADASDGIRAGHDLCVAERIAVVCRVGAVNVKGLNVCAAVFDLHIDAGQRDVAGVLDREHDVDVVAGADARILGRSGHQLRRADQLVGELGERLPQIGALAGLQIHRVEAGAAVLQLDGVGALLELHHVEGATDRIRAGVIAQAAHHILCLRRRFRRVRGRAFRPVQIHARAELDDVKLVRVDLHSKIRNRRERGRFHQIQRRALKLVDVFAVLQLDPLQIEQPVLGIICINLAIDPEIDDVLIDCQRLPL